MSLYRKPGPCPKKNKQPSRRAGKIRADANHRDCGGHRPGLLLACTTSHECGDQPVYDAFAKCLTEKQIKMYGLYWCTHCAEQKEMFCESFKHVTYIEWGSKDRRTKRRLQGSRRQELSHMAISRWIKERRHTAIASLKSAIGMQPAMSSKARRIFC